MVVKPLSKGSIIPSEEKATAEILCSLPNDWLCICGDKDTYFSFLKKDKKIRGTQIDFVIISEYGIFFLECKNVSIIKSDYNNLIFETQQGEDYEPLYRAIEYPNLAKNWFIETFRQGKKANHLYKKSDLRFGIWGTVVITNDNYRTVSPQRELKLTDIIQHKQFNLVHRSELKKGFFKNFYNTKKAPHHETLSQEDIFFLFNVMLNQNIDIDSVLTPDTERVYEMLSYVNKYKTIPDKMQDKNSNIVELLKEEKYELQSQKAVLQQENTKIKEEHQINLQRLQDQHILIETLEEKLKTENEKNKLATDKNKEQQHTIDVFFKTITKAFSSIIKHKYKHKDEIEKYEKKLKATKNIKTISLFSIPILALMIVAIIILSVVLSNEIAKEPPTPSSMFSEVYNEIKTLYEKKDYEGLIQKYKNSPYNFEWLSSKNVTGFSYYLGVAYFSTGLKNSSTKDAGIRIINALNMSHLSIDEILAIYPDVYYYLKDVKRYSEAGEILGKIEKAINSQLIKVLLEKNGLFSILNAKMFFIEAVSKIDKNDLNEFGMLYYLSYGKFSDKAFVLEDYIGNVYTLINDKVMQYKETRGNSYPPLESENILNAYKKFTQYIFKIRDAKISEYEENEPEKRRFANLLITIYTEMGVIYVRSNKDYKSAIEILKKAQNEYNTVKEFFLSNAEKLSIYISMFLLMGDSYEILADLCKAYESYWNALKIAEKIRTKIEVYPHIEGKFQFLKGQIIDNFGSLSECSFESEELKKSQ